MSLTPQPWNSSANLRTRGQHPSQPERRLEDLLNALETAVTVGSYQVPPGDHAPAGLQNYGRALRRHKVALAVFAVTCAAAGWFLSQRQPKVYQAQTTLELLEPNRPVMNMQNFTSGGNSILSQEVYMDTQ